MPKFKRGDRVEFTAKPGSTNYTPRLVGFEGTVMDVGVTQYGVKWDGYTFGHDGVSGCTIEWWWVGPYEISLARGVEANE